MLRMRMPFAELVKGFFDDLKRISHGYAALEYDDPTYDATDLVKLDVQVNKAMLSALSMICVRDAAQQNARGLARALRENLSRTIIDLPIQVLIGGKCIARETVGALRKDVTAKCHAGDPSRKNKKLQEQKRGKARLAKRLVGQVSIDQETLMNVVTAARRV
jgi:GTP-binding protein LepA